MKNVPVVVAVPTRGYVWHETAQALAPYNPIYCREKISVANVRNRIVKNFLGTNAQFLVMCDDDVVPDAGYIEALIECPYDIIGAAVPIAKMPQNRVFLNIFNELEDGRIMTAQIPQSGHAEVGAVGTGLIAIRRRVLEHPDMKAPFLQELDEDGCIVTGQDIEFCRKARKAGFTVGVCADAVCDHFIMAHANAIALAYEDVEGAPADARSYEPGSFTSKLPS